MGITRELFSRIEKEKSTTREKEKKDTEDDTSNGEKGKEKGGGETNPKNHHIVKTSKSHPVYMISLCTPFYFSHLQLWLFSITGDCIHHILGKTHLGDILGQKSASVIDL